MWAAVLAGEPALVKVRSGGEGDGWRPSQHHRHGVVEVEKAKRQGGEGC